MEKEGEDPTAPTTYVGGDVFMRYMERADKKFADERAAADRKVAEERAASDARFAEERREMLAKYEENKEAISSLSVELKQGINEIKKDCGTATSKADEAVQKIEKLEGVVTTLQVDLGEKIQSTVESQVQDLGQRIESRLDKLEREDNTLTILGSDMTVAQGNIESLKKAVARLPQDSAGVKIADSQGQLLKAHNESVKKLSMGQQALEIG